MKWKIFLLLLFSCTILSAGPKLSPWDAWRMAYTSFEKGEELRDKGNYTEALRSFQNAGNYYRMVQESRPDWNQKVISERLADCERESRKMRGFLGSAAIEKQAAEARAATAFIT